MVHDLWRQKREKCRNLVRSHSVKTVMSHTCNCRGDTRIIVGRTPSICQISRQSSHPEQQCYVCTCGQMQQGYIGDSGDKEHKVIVFLEVI